MAKGGLCTFRIGAAPKRGEGLRIGVTRLPPRGVPRKDWRRHGLFDVWFPVLAPSTSLFRRYRSRIEDPDARKRFFDLYERELHRSAEARQTVELLAALSLRTSISIGCFCDDETRCHRSRLFRVIEKEAARLRRREVSD